ncbi:nitroreductase family deazaflavin-dependent oxidoreductase [Mycobacterium deserti]|uniref:Nitroreductase family deazaflavin-dependent oxidoreductase n=1 Tax=Mycobacterium deserti TaxID=2978347 RepID=A0ABT2M652_9MYCO|nr:nitroreductase family deazaflavin-dependent oxidoreductase [Mycobacterium deserti]MCT7657734.1 nitroreductase family deazaflavin-dependent oxidoreductase [Mycobacterium deserti]
MADADAAAIRAERGDWMQEHLAMYLDSGGAQGHIVDLSYVGGRELTTHCLIRYTGRKSGKTYVKPLIYGNVAGEAVIVASKGGADEHPEWYLNILASETIGVQIATQAFEATWREPEDTERHEVWEYMCHLYPPYVSYQQSTSRHIPLVMLTPVRSTEVFTSQKHQLP